MRFEVRKALPNGRWSAMCQPRFSAAIRAAKREMGESIIDGARVKVRRGLPAGPACGGGEAKCGNSGTFFLFCLAVPEEKESCDSRRNNRRHGDDDRDFVTRYKAQQSIAIQCSQQRYNRIANAPANR